MQCTNKVKANAQFKSTFHHLPWIIFLWLNHIFIIYIMKCYCMDVYSEIVTYLGFCIRGCCIKLVNRTSWNLQISFVTDKVEHSYHFQALGRHCCNIGNLIYYLLCSNTWFISGKSWSTWRWVIQLHSTLVSECTVCVGLFMLVLFV